MANMENDPKAKEVLDQEISVDDLNAVAGGARDGDGCTDAHERHIYGIRGFPNCARSVEDGSHCDNTDACYSNAVVYQGIHRCYGGDCVKAWR